MGVFNNIGNFGQKLKEEQKRRREKNLMNLKTKAQQAKEKRNYLEEKDKLNKEVQKTKDLEKQQRQQKVDNVRKFLGNVQQKAQNAQTKSRSSPFTMSGGTGFEDFGNNKSGSEKSRKRFDDI